MNYFIIKIKIKDEGIFPIGKYIKTTNNGVHLNIMRTLQKYLKTKILKLSFIEHLNFIQVWNRVMLKLKSLTRT